uniref:SCP domain-containing protein n=1 Tax=Strongyloides venezuelensis TaxID=75913 RepID=A0A0K0FIX3_STRVS
MLSTHYKIIFILFIFINLAYQLKLFPYQIKLKKSSSFFEYNGHSYTTMAEMVRKIIKEKDFKDINNICTYCAGFLKHGKFTRMKLQTCEGVKSFLYPFYKPTKYCITYPNSHAPNIYLCGYKVFTNFELALEYSLRNNFYIKFGEDVAQLLPAPKNFCVITVYDKLCYVKNWNSYHIWKTIWSNCNNNCYYYKKFAHTKKRYLDEINYYRKSVGNSALVLYIKLAILAQERADLMAKYGRLMSDRNKYYDELIASSEHGHGIYLMKILYDDAWSHNPNFNRISTKKREMARLLSSNQKHIGIGISKQVIPYLVNLSPTHYYIEYKGHKYNSVTLMAKKILKEKYIEHFEDVCLYNAGYIKKGKIFKTFGNTCDSILPFIYQHYSQTKIEVMYPNSHREDVYTCGNDVAYKFPAILDYALIKHCFIKFKPRGLKPMSPPANSCIYTLYGKKCHMKNSIPPSYWKKIWFNCNSDCYFSSNFVTTEKNYLREINYYRKFFKNNPLYWNMKLSGLAQNRANYMAKHKRLLADPNKKYDELIVYAPSANGIYLVKLLFDEAKSEYNNINKLSARKKEMARLLTSNQRYVGFGMAKNGNAVYICVKFTPMSM